MAPLIRILDINPGSDGDGRKWPKHHYIRNDDYFIERIASDKWIHDLPGGAERNVVYHLNKLPNGYAGFERARPDSKHIDRYIYGHPNGQFRSLNEFYPHFKHLMDYGGPAGCACIKCKGNGAKKKTTEGVRMTRKTTPPTKSKYFAPADPQADRDAPQPTHLISPYVAKSATWIDEDSRLHFETSERPKRKLFDDEGTPDIYETLLNRLRDGNHDSARDIPIEESMSPDWRSGNALATELLGEWRELPQYVPRVGEVVLFVRNLSDNTRISFDKSIQSFRLRDEKSSEWLQVPKWEAGVVTQTPVEPVQDEDLLTDDDKEQGVNYSGFRVEPLSAPESGSKAYSKQYKHVPLHAMRPFIYWRECLDIMPEAQWHPSIQHALTICSSFSVVGRYRFKGAWPNATILARGVYIGSEMIMLGDTVRLLPRKSKQAKDIVTDVMVVTAIRLRFVNLDAEGDDTAPDHALPHQTSLHISGKVYTRDPTRSFDGVGKVPIDTTSDFLVQSGPWFYYTDPERPSARIEVPYTRILSRCFEDIALESWFNPQAGKRPTFSTKSLGKAPVKEQTSIPSGLSAVIESRKRSQKTDKRIKLDEGKTWFWADTRAEQLDLSEINGRHVSTTDNERTLEAMRRWRTALKAMDGKKDPLEEYHAARKADTIDAAAGPFGRTYGMVAASRQVHTETSAQESESGEDDAMDVDDVVEVEHHNSTVMEGDNGPEPEALTHEGLEIWTVSDDSEDEEQVATNHLASELAKNIRQNDPRLR